MKIIIVCYPTFGGSGILATELGHKLSKNGHVVHFIAYEKPVRLEVNDENIFSEKFQNLKGTDLTWQVCKTKDDLTTYEVKLDKDLSR